MSDEHYHFEQVAGAHEHLLGDGEPAGDAGNKDESSAHENLVFNQVILIVLGMLMIYMGFEAFKHKHHLSFGHEASVVTLVGFLISYLYLTQGNLEFGKLMKFNDNLFFYVILPPIVFASGFNMQRHKFFANLGNILLFGVIGTFFAFASFSALTIVYRDYIAKDGKLQQVNGETWEYSVLDLSTMEILLMCSLLCSSDVIAAVSMINPRNEPKLFSMVFGEGITNDAVSIILFNTVMRFTSKNKDSSQVNTGSILNAVGDFFSLGCYSILLGITFGLSCSYLIKRVRALTKTPVSECAMLFSFAYISYVTAELFHLSGIITLLACGIVMANYAWFNLSTQGKQSSVVIFQFVGFVAEGFVFAYLGLTFFAYRSFQWSLELICVEFVIILVGRFFGTFGLIGFLKIFGYEKGNPQALTFREILFIWYAGLIRGAIAFGLVLRINPSLANRNVIVTTCLALVVFTTVFFGSTVGLLNRCLFGKKAKAEARSIKNQGKPGSAALVKNDTMKTIPEDAKAEEEQDADASSDLSQALSDEDQSVLREELLHYNEQAHELDDEYRRAIGHGNRTPTCKDLLIRFEEYIMRPIFIYKYEKNHLNEQQRLVDFYNQFAQIIERDFTKNSA